MRARMITIALTVMVWGPDEAKSQVSLHPEKQPWDSPGWR